MQQESVYVTLSLSIIFLLIVMLLLVYLKVVQYTYATLNFCFIVLNVKRYYVITLTIFSPYSVGKMRPMTHYLFDYSDQDNLFCQIAVADYR